MNQPATFRTSIVTLLPNKRKSFRIVTIFEVFSAVYGDFNRFLRFLRFLQFPIFPHHSTLFHHAMCAFTWTTWYVSAGYSCHVRRQKDHMARFGQVFMPCVPPIKPHGTLRPGIHAMCASKWTTWRKKVGISSHVVPSIGPHGAKRRVLHNEIMHGREIHALYKHQNIKLFRKTSAKKGKPKN